METNMLLKYRRECDCWVCPECDTENNMSYEKCTLCGCERTAAVNVLRAWSEADERAEMAATVRKPAPPRAVPRKPAPGYSKTFTDDGYVPEEPEHVGFKAIWIIVAILLVIVLIVGLSQWDTYAKYKNAREYFENGSHEQALLILQDVSKDYKDAQYLYDESSYQLACEKMNSGDFTGAESLFDSVLYYNDSAEMLNECRYRDALSLYYNGEYAKAMSRFYFLDTYGNSNSFFYDSESALVSQNVYSDYYNDDAFLNGEWNDDSGNYINYLYDSSGSRTVNYNLPYTAGTYYKVSDGIHYHGDDYSGWDRQWIIQRIDHDTIDVYCYIDGQVYTMNRS